VAEATIASSAEPRAAAQAPGRRGRIGQIVRFLLVGGSNTLVTLVLFVLLQRWLSPTSAYTVVFALGLAYTTAMTATVVFGATLSWRSAVCFVGWYLLVYGIGVLVLRGLHLWWQPSHLTTAIITVAVTAPLNFLGGRLLFEGRRAQAAEV
jgi:putative flippase GtrA